MLSCGCRMLQWMHPQNNVIKISRDVRTVNFLHVSLRWIFCYRADDLLKWLRLPVSQWNSVPPFHMSDRKPDTRLQLLLRWQDKADLLPLPWQVHVRKLCTIVYIFGKAKSPAIRDVPNIRFRLVGYLAIFYYPVPAPAKMVPRTGYLNRIVIGPFWQLVHP